MSDVLAHDRAQLRSLLQQHERCRKRVRGALDQQTVALAKPVEQLQGTVKSTTQLMGERSNAVMDRLQTAEGGMAQLEVQQKTLAGQFDAIGNPITRSEVQQMVVDAVRAELDGQVTPEKIKQVVRESFIPAAPSTSIDVLNLPDPQFAPIPGKG